MLLNDYLRDQRVAAGLTLMEASQKLGYSDFKFLSNIELGKKPASIELLQKMCEVYGVSSSDMRDAYINEAKRRATDVATGRWDND